MYETAKDAIRSACQVATKDGWKLTPNRWVSPYTKECCPLGAVLVAADSIPDNRARARMLTTTWV